MTRSPSTATSLGPGIFPSSNSFHDGVGEWKGLEQRVEEVLVALSHALRQAGRQYAEIGESNARLFR